MEFTISELESLRVVLIIALQHAKEHSQDNSEVHKFKVLEEDVKTNCNTILFNLKLIKKALQYGIIFTRSQIESNAFIKVSSELVANTFDITVENVLSGEENTLAIPISYDQLRRWRNGEFVQNVMPELHPELREFLISGLLPGEFDAVFKKK